MVNNIVNIPVVPVPAPSSSSGAQSGSGTQNNTAAANTAQDTTEGSQNTVQTQSGQAGGNNSTGTADNNSDGKSKFETALAAAQSSGQVPAASVKGANDNTNTGAGNNNSNSGNNSGNDPVTQITQVALVVSQLLDITSGDTAGAGTNAAAGNTPDNGQPSAADLLQQLQQLLQELMQKITQLAQGGGTGTDVSTTDTMGSQPNTNNASSKTAGDNPLADALSQLIAMVTQFQQALTQNSGISADTTELSAVTSEVQNVTNVLQQLSNALSVQLGTTANATATSSNAIPTDLANAVSTVAGTFDQMLQDFLNNTGSGNGNKTAAPVVTAPTTTATNILTNDISALQSALSHLTDSITSFTSVTNPDSQNTDKSNSGNGSANDTSNTTQIPLGAVNNVQQPVGSQVKFAAAVQQTQAPSPVDQVTVQIKNAIETGQSQIKIQLEPADLGKVQVQMVTGVDGKTSITITADNRQTLNMLQSEARSLENSLRDIGMKTNAGGLSFNLSGQGQNTNPGGNQGGYTQVAAIGEEDDSELAGTVTSSYQLSVQTGVDIRV